MTHATDESPPPAPLRERVLTLLAGAALGLACLAVAFCGYAFNKPIVRNDVDDQPFPIQEHRAEWSCWSALCAGVALALAIPPLLHARSGRGWPRAAASLAGAVGLAVIVFWIVFLVRWRW